MSRKLDKAGIIYGVRGSSGGYVLSRPLTEITLYDVHQAIEPHSLVCECLKQDVSCLLTQTETHVRFERNYYVFKKI